MGGARYVLLGLAPARTPWFGEIARWSNASSIAAEFVKCVSVSEVRARLAGGRPFSALLIDVRAPALDRDLIDTAQQSGCAVVVLGDRQGGRDWLALGANAALATPVDRKELLDVLAAHSAMIGRADRLVTDDGDEKEAGGIWQAPLAAVCGAGGTGVSTVAIALAQGLAADVRGKGQIVLADLALHAEQAMLHDARDVVPGVQELVDACRSTRPTVHQVRSLAFSVAERDYALLLGLRRSRAWATIRPRGFAAALEALRRSYRIVIADVDAEVEGEDEGGSMDVEERHVMARTTLAAASTVLVVGSPGMKGLYSLVRVTSDLLTFGVPSPRILPVINRAPRSVRLRAQLTAAYHSLLPDWTATAPPLFLLERRIDQALRDGVGLPDTLTTPLARAFTAVNDRAGNDTRPATPQRVVAGSLGRWADDTGDAPGADTETASG
jgi:hypothetical protein